VGFERSEVPELGGVLADVAVERMGEEREAALESVHHAAIGGVAKAIQLVRVPDGKRAEHDGVDEREDRGVGANPQRENGHGDRREPRLSDQRPRGLADVPHKRVHGLTSDA
jgi:hypothetical protein